MKTKHAVQVGSHFGAAFLIVAANAIAGTISYTTSNSGTGFVVENGVSQSPNLMMNGSGGEIATLTFVPNASSTTGIPSNLDLGDFLLVCNTCTGSQTTTFNSFTFDLVVNDFTDGATGEFVGTSSGGTVSTDTSTVQVNWQSPLSIGPGTNAALSGNFGSTHFDLVSPISLIVAPNSGTPPGDTTIQGQVGSVAPEPGTISLAAGALLVGFGIIKRRKPTLI